MQRVQDAVDAWATRLPTPDLPAEGSSLGRDDETFPPMPCSQLAWYGLTVGVEHLDAALRLLRQQVDSGRPLLSSANYTVLRAALVGASQAAVLLMPSNRDERTNYGLQIAHEEYRQAYNFRKHLLDHPGLVAAGRDAAEGQDFLTGLLNGKNQAKELLAGRGVTSTKLSDTEMVEKAADLVHFQGEDAEMLQLALEMEWRLGSGAAHGRLLMAMHRTGGFQREGSTALFGATFEGVAQQICGVSLVVNEAWGAWDRRRVPPPRA